MKWMPNITNFVRGDSILLLFFDTFLHLKCKLVVSNKRLWIFFFLIAVTQTSTPWIFYDLEYDISF